MTTTQTWKISDLKTNPHQAEIFGDVNDAELQILAADIERNGLRHPLEITANGIIIDGHQRLRALQLLQWSEAPVHIYHDISNDEIKERLITANLNRRQLDPVSKARSTQALADLEYARKGIYFDAGRAVEFREHLARRLGGNISGRTVDRYLQLLRLPRAVQDAVSNGTLAMTKAIKVLGLAEQEINTIGNRISAGENAKYVVDEYVDNWVYQDDEEDETAELTYSQLLELFDEWVDELIHHAEELVRAVPYESAIESLPRAIEFLNMMLELTRAAEDDKLDD